ncbi:enoyl-CoA hydratase [Chloroflexus sp.]|uniref:enoyl-CoA hydratase n=1 Tax=Chloroflexus sp. TaxID=1904827 RepID=UPI002ADD95C6|nr:enoyl-CoA hydratase [Chloroflexus sp.]
MERHEVAVEPFVLSEIDGRGVIRLTLNRPRQFNALSEEMLAALQRELDAIAANPQARVVVLAGAGKAFCAGHDLKQMQAHPDQAYYEDLFARCTQMMLTIQRLPQPVIARVHGIATAAGCQLVAMCDLAVASTEARFAVSGITVGLFCSTPSVALSRNIGRKAAFEMLVTGEFIDAVTAQRLGLVNRVAAPADLDAEVQRLVDAILAKPAESIAIGKSLFYRQLELPMEEAYRLAGQTMACNMMEPCAQEGVSAFVEKRPPAWANVER